MASNNPISNKRSPIDFEVLIDDLDQQYESQDDEASVGYTLARSTQLKIQIYQFMHLTALNLYFFLRTAYIALIFQPQPTFPTSQAKLPCAGT